MTSSTRFHYPDLSDTIELVCPLRIKEGKEGKEARLKMEWGWWASRGQNAQSSPVESGKVDGRKDPRTWGERLCSIVKSLPEAMGHKGNML